jgi:hypothetical protein
MDDKDFDKTDRSFMAALKGLREKPSGRSHGLAADVERHLRAGAPPSRTRVRVLPWLVPALGFSLVLLIPGLRPAQVTAPSEGRIQLASRPAVSALDEEIALLKEVGAWTEDDDRRVAPETEYEEIELSRAASATRIV